MVVVDGTTYSSIGLYYKFLVETRANTGFTTGSFEFLAKNENDSNDPRILARWHFRDIGTLSNALLL